MYPKMQRLNSDDADSLAGIVNASYVKRNSGRHLLAQFTEVELAALAQTEIAMSLERQTGESRSARQAPEAVESNGAGLAFLRC